MCEVNMLFTSCKFSINQIFNQAFNFNQIFNQAFNFNLTLINNQSLPFLSTFVLAGALIADMMQAIPCGIFPYFLWAIQ